MVLLGCCTTVHSGGRQRSRDLNWSKINPSLLNLCFTGRACSRQLYLYSVCQRATGPRRALMRFSSGCWGLRRSAVFPRRLRVLVLARCPLLCSTSLVASPMWWVRKPRSVGCSMPSRAVAARSASAAICTSALCAGGAGGEEAWRPRRQ